MTSAKTISDTNNFLSSIVDDQKDILTRNEIVYYVLAKEFGITFTTLKDLPVSYIIALLKTHSFVKKEEEKAQKK